MPNQLPIRQPAGQPALRLASSIASMSCGHGVRIFSEFLVAGGTSPDQAAKARRYERPMRTESQGAFLGIVNEINPWGIVNHRQLDEVNLLVRAEI